MAAVIIMMIIGVIIGTWLAGGIVPAMIYYGLKLLNPSIFLVVTLLLCSIISVATGSSWTSVATVGIALMGIGQGLVFRFLLLVGVLFRVHTLEIKCLPYQIQPILHQVLQK